MRSDEICVGLIGATLAIVGALALLSSNPGGISNKLLNTVLNSQLFERNGPIQEAEQSYEETINDENLRPPFSQPELRISKTLEPFNYIKSNGDVMSPTELVQERQPVLLRGWAERNGLKNVVNKWKNEEYLKESFQGWGLRNVRGQIHSPNFKLSTLSNNNIMMFDGLPMTDFFDSAHEATVPYCYYTVGLEEWDAIGSFAQDGSGWKNLSVKEVENGQDLSMAMLWLSHPHVTAHPHFDKSQNFLTQVIGKKRVLLWSPEQTPYLYPHQEKDEFKKQSQVDFFSPDLVQFPNFLMASAIEVIMEPGDTLYIPPFWWHRISTQNSVSLSLSVVSPSKVEAILAAANYVPLPFLRKNATKYPTYLKHVKETDVDVEVRVVAVQVFLGHLISHLKANLNGMDAQKLANKLRETLYEPNLNNYQNHQGGMNSGGMTSEDFLSVKESEEFELLLRYCDAGSGFRDPAKHQAILGKLPKVSIAKAASKIVETLLELGDYEDGGILEWWLMEYVDDLARWTLGYNKDMNAAKPLKIVGVLDEFAERCIGALSELPEPVEPGEWVEGPPALKIEDIEED